ncbi:UNVERIFIED_CONTAM: hypothetical protein NY603_39305, partial [Bacteroidetes bacterium 56_B9]
MNSYTLSAVPSSGTLSAPGKVDNPDEYLERLVDIWKRLCGSILKGGALFESIHLYNIEPRLRSRTDTTA